MPARGDGSPAFSGIIPFPRSSDHGPLGGMVGASYYVTWLRQQLGDPAAEGCKPLPSKGWIREIPIFSLSPVARSVALRDPFFTTFR